MKEVRVGCSGWSYDDWRGDFYPPGTSAARWLEHYATAFDIGAGIARYWERIEPLREAGKLGPVLWQLPERFHRDDEILAAALAALPPAEHCFEFRHPSWFTADVFELLEGTQLAQTDANVPPLWTFRPISPEEVFDSRSRVRRGA